MATTGRGRIITLVLVVIVILLAGEFVYTYEQDSSTISSLEQTVSSQSSMISSQLSQLDLDATKMSNLSATVTTLRGQVASLNSQADLDRAKITSLTSGFNQANGTAVALQSQVGNLNSQIANLDAQVATLNNQIAADQSELASLQLQIKLLESTLTAFKGALVNPIAQLIEGNLTVSIQAGSEAQYYFWGIGTNGVIVVGVESSSSPDTYVSLSSVPVQTDVGHAGIAAFNVVECCDGYNVSIYAANMAAFTATINIWYFHL